MNNINNVTAADWDNYPWEYLEKIRAKRRMKKVLKYIPTKGIHLDIGTGRGEGTYEVAKIKNTIGIDYGSRSLKIAKTYDLKLAQTDARYLPFKTGFFDSITALDVAEHIPKPYLFFSEVYRVLKPDGVFILQTPVEETENLKTWSKKVYGKYKIIRFLDKIADKIRVKITNEDYAPKEKHSNIVMKQPYDTVLTNRDLIKLFHNSNFEIIKRKKINYFVRELFIQLFSYSDLFICKKKGN